MFTTRQKQQKTWKLFVKVDQVTCDYNIATTKTRQLEAGV